MKKLVEILVFFNAKIESKCPKKVLEWLLVEKSILFSLFILFYNLVFLSSFSTPKLYQKYIGSSILLPIISYKGSFHL
jgi:hypothetical protein